MQKVQDALIQSFLKARMEMLQLENEEDGMETVETVVLVAVAVGIAATLLKYASGQDGFINSIFTSIEGTISSLFSSPQ